MSSCLWPPVPGRSLCRGVMAQELPNPQHRRSIMCAPNPAARCIGDMFNQKPEVCPDLLSVLQGFFCLLSTPERGKTIRIPWFYFLGNRSSPSSSPSLLRTENKPEPNTPATPTPSHHDLPHACARGSAPPEAELQTPESFAEEPQTFLQPGEQPQPHGRPAAGSRAPTHCSGHQLGAGTLCFSPEIMAWIHRREV